MHMAKNPAERFIAYYLPPGINPAMLKAASRIFFPIGTADCDPKPPSTHSLPGSVAVGPNSAEVAMDRAASPGVSL